MKFDGRWCCTCPDHTYRKVECKHIWAVKLWLELRKKLETSKTQEGTVKCKWCGSDKVIKYGHESGKQVYKCKACNRKFVPDNEFRKLKYDPKIITTVLDLYFKGLSLRKIADHIKQFYGLKVSQICILKWIRKYIALMKEYVSDFIPQVGGKWHVDEMTVNVNGEYRWL